VNVSAILTRHGNPRTGTPVTPFRPAPDAGQRPPAPSGGRFARPPAGVPLPSSRADAALG
jgi:hypothetical protein